MTDVPETQPRPARFWPVALIVAAASLLLGVGIGGGAVLLAGWRQPDQRDFVVWIYLKDGVTAEQKAAVQTTLDKIPSAGGVTFVSSRDAYEAARTDPANKDLVAILGESDPASWPQRFEVETTGTEFRCEQVSALWKAPGVQQVRVAMVYTKDQPGAEISC
ncbi:permease-like cell division protein FtsX [Paractinoplanes toevensis]|uniref:FtsX extracellular domain-containing protein n=1 Tax=Paractinoplanes toevensis TaxID=571911 RepID=A0A919W3I9_9ACTN|nr:permease-like cell division protein FtsX [Actinoplanes toevensis]GIM94817.1 hypothetical protein Ato02nite_066100 [Actinoplanes toevensis]